MRCGEELQSGCCCARAAQVPAPALKGPEQTGSRGLGLQWEQKLKSRTDFLTGLVPCEYLLVARLSAVPSAWRLQNHGFALHNVPGSSHHSLFLRVQPVLVVSWPLLFPCSSYFHLVPCTEPLWCWEGSSQEQTKAAAVKNGGTT